jgi:hypothetical protein
MTKKQEIRCSISNIKSIRQDVQFLITRKSQKLQSLDSLPRYRKFKTKSLINYVYDSPSGVSVWFTYPCVFVITYLRVSGPLCSSDLLFLCWTRSSLFPSFLEWFSDLLFLCSILLVCYVAIVLLCCYCFAMLLLLC